MSHTRTRAGAKRTGRMTHSIRGGNDPRTPSEPEYRPEAHEPLPPGDLTAQFAEMWANDDEAIEWRRAEERAAWAVRR